MEAGARTALDVALRRLLEDFGPDVLDDPARVRGIVTDLLGEHAQRPLVDAVVAASVLGDLAPEAATAALVAGGAPEDLAADVAAAWGSARVARIERLATPTLEPPVDATLLPEDAAPGRELVAPTILPAADDVWGDASTSEPVVSATDEAAAEHAEPTADDDADDAAAPLAAAPLAAAEPDAAEPDSGPETETETPATVDAPPAARADAAVAQGSRGPSRRAAVAVVAAVVLLALVGGALALTGGGDDDDEVATDATTTSTEPGGEEDESTTTSSSSASTTTIATTIPTTETTAAEVTTTTRRSTTTTTRRNTTTTAPPPPPPSTTTAPPTTTTTAAPAPVANNDGTTIYPEASGGGWSSHAINVTGNDSGQWDQVIIASYPDGRLSQSGSTFYYSPYKNGPYTDSFGYRLRNSATGRTSNVATVSVSVQCNSAYTCGA